MYVDVLRLNTPERAEKVGFGDDIAVIITAKHIQEAERIAQTTAQTIINWLESIGLKLAEEKTEAVLISSRKILEVAHVKIGSHTIKSKPFIRYLGVIIDARLNFKEHVKFACKKAETAAKGASSVQNSSLSRSGKVHLSVCRNSMGRNFATQNKWERVEGSSQRNCSTCVQRFPHSF